MNGMASASSATYTVSSRAAGSLALGGACGTRSPEGLVNKMGDAGQDGRPAGRTDGPWPRVNPVIDMLQERTQRSGGWQSGQSQRHDRPASKPALGRRPSTGDASPGWRQVPRHRINAATT